jgi:hypothetical protein
MSRSSLTRTCALLAVLVAAALSPSAAQAETIDANSVPTLGTGNFQFKNGRVDWYYHGSSFQVELWGTLVLDHAAGSCARMRLDYLYHGPFVGTPRYGGEVCAPDGGKNEWSVDLASPDIADIDNVRVSLETKTASHDWSILASNYSPPQPPSDKARLHSKGFDFGDNYFSDITQQTSGSATMYWNRGDGATYTPRLIGTLWLKGVAGVCARMHLTYNDDLGHRIVDKYGGPACAAGNNLQAFNVDLSPYTATNIRSVTVRMQTHASNDSWNDITDASDTVYIDYY